MRLAIISTTNTAGFNRNLKSTKNHQLDLLNLLLVLSRLENFHSGGTLGSKSSLIV